MLHAVRPGLVSHRPYPNRALIAVGWLCGLGDEIWFWHMSINRG
jgi:hypothetical protein